MTRYALVSGFRFIAGGFESAIDALLFGASYFPHHPLTFHPEAPTMTCPRCDDDEWTCPACGESRPADPIAPCPSCKDHCGAECAGCGSPSPLRALAGGGA